MSDLTAEEQDRVREVLRFFRKRTGGWEALGKAIGFKGTTLHEVASGRASVSASITFRLAKLAGVPVDDLLAGKYPPPDTCPYCGHCPTAH